MKRKSSRGEVFRCLEDERNFQDTLFKNQAMTIDQFLLRIGFYLRKAEDTQIDSEISQACFKHFGGNTPRPNRALHELRKIAALCVKCFEQHGIQERWKT